MNNLPNAGDIVRHLPSGNAVAVIFDDSTDYLREMRRRAETPEDSDVILEMDLPEPPEGLSES